MSDDKLPRDRAGEIYQDDLTENQTKPGGPIRDDLQHTERLDPNVDSQEADEAMAENRFGVNEKRTDR